MTKTKFKPSIIRGGNIQALPLSGTTTVVPEMCKIVKASIDIPKPTKTKWEQEFIKTFTKKRPHGLLWKDLGDSPELVMIFIRQTLQDQVKPPPRRKDSLCQ